MNPVNNRRTDHFGLHFLWEVGSNPPCWKLVAIVTIITCFEFVNSSLKLQKI